MFKNSSLMQRANSWSDNRRASIRHAHRTNPHAEKLTRIRESQRKLSGILATTHLQNARLKHSAKEMVNQNNYTDTAPIQRIIKRSKLHHFTDHDFDELYDSNLATILSSKFYRQDAMHHAIASQADGSDFNYIFANLDDPDSYEFVHDGNNWNLLVYSGTIFDADGNRYYGQFPEPIQVDIYDSCQLDDDPLMYACERHGIPLVSSSKAINICLDKDRFKRWASPFQAKLGFNLPKGQIIHSQKQIDNLEEPAYELVAKPLKGIQGNGVEIIDHKQDIKAIKRRLTAKLKEEKRFLVEQRINSYPIYQNGKRQDWNLRIIVSPQGAFRINGRIGKWGKVINKDKGAKHLSVLELEKLLLANGFEGEEFEATMYKVEEITKKLAKEIDSQYFALDVIIDEEKNIWLIEGEAQHAGGLLSEMERTGNDQPIAYKFLKQLRVGKRSKHGDIKLRRKLSQNPPHASLLEVEELIKYVEELDIGDTESKQAAIRTLEAAEELIEAGLSGKELAVSLFNLAEAYDNLKEQTKAYELYSRFRELSPVYGKIHEDGKTEKIELIHPRPLYLGLVTGNLDYEEITQYFKNLIRYSIEEAVETSKSLISQLYLNNHGLLANDLQKHLAENGFFNQEEYVNLKFNFSQFLLTMQLMDPENDYLPLILFLWLSVLREDGENEDTRQMFLAHGYENEEINRLLEETVNLDIGDLTYEYFEKLERSFTEFSDLVNANSGVQ